MEWYGEKMLPRGLPELVYQITPPEILKDLKVISLNRKRKKDGMSRVGREGDYWIIQLYPTVILKNCGGLGTQSFCYWLRFLKTMLHEIGHIMTREMVSEECKQRYEHDSESHHYIESLADTWRDHTIERIASRDPRLGQPVGWIGGLPGVYLLEGIRISRRDDPFGTFKNKQIKNFRAKKCGGQHSIDDVAKMVWEYSPYRRRIYRIIKHVASDMGITRAYLDSAGRKHLFFNNGEAIAVSAEVRKNTFLKRCVWVWAKEEVKRYEEEKESIPAE